MFQYLSSWFTKHTMGHSIVGQTDIRSGRRRLGQHSSGLCGWTAIYKKKCLITFLSLFYWYSHVCCFYIKWLIFFCRNGVDALMHSTFKTTSSIIHQLGYQKKVSISFLLLLLVVLYVLYCTHTTANSLTNSCMAALATTLATIVPSFLP